MTAEETKTRHIKTRNLGNLPNRIRTKDHEAYRANYDEIKWPSRSEEKGPGAEGVPGEPKVAEQRNQ